MDEERFLDLVGNTVLGEGNSAGGKVYTATHEIGLRHDYMAEPPSVLLLRPRGPVLRNTT